MLVQIIIYLIIFTHFLAYDALRSITPPQDLRHNLFIFLDIFNIIPPPSLICKEIFMSYIAKKNTIKSSNKCNNYYKHFLKDPITISVVKICLNRKVSFSFDSKHSKFSTDINDWLFFTTRSNLKLLINLAGLYIGHSLKRIKPRTASIDVFNARNLDFYPVFVLILFIVLTY